MTKEFQGMLRAKGAIALKQFWPGGKSDADTVVVKVKAGSFEFSRDPDSSQPFKKTTALQDAHVGGKKVIAQGKVRVRLQGVDAPELHYRDYQRGWPTGNVEYRQHLAETSTVAVHDLLARAGVVEVDCRIETRVDRPSDVFDKYGRFIGDVIVTIGGQDVRLCRWLIEGGHAYPAYYNSMRNDEILALQKLANQARNKSVQAHYTSRIRDLDRTLRYRPNGPPDPVADRGEVILPKVFRRLVMYTIKKLNGAAEPSFQAALARNRDDKWARRKDFLKNRGIQPNKTLVPPFTGNNVFAAKPDELVFYEARTPRLKDAQGNPITKW